MNSPYPLWRHCGTLAQRTIFSLPDESDASYDRVVRFRKRSSEPDANAAEVVEPLNEAEQDWVTTNVEEARRMLDGKLSAQALDDLWASLLSEEPADPNPAINMVGLAFGQLLADRLGLSWVAVTDEHGTEIAVRGHADFTVFPTNFVAKRYAGRETNFIAAAYDEMVQTAELLG
jgi:hypothetical protein